MSDKYPKFKAAAIQTAPVFFDREATIDKACKMIGEAAANGAEFIVFPEAYIPAYPYWNRFDNPYRGRKYFLELFKNAIEIPSPYVDRLCQCARKTNAHVVIGINEKVPETLGTLYNSNLIIDRKGKILGVHRKLVPTYIEKITYGRGDGYSLRTYDTECGKIGTLICGENVNSLARYALVAQGEQVHAANFLGLPASDESKYNLSRGIELRCAAHAYEGKLFNVVACGIFSKEIAEFLAESDDKRHLLDKGSVGLTAIFGPDGEFMTEPLDPNVEGMAIAEIEIERIIVEKLLHDITGHYNRFGVLSLNLNRRKQKPIWEGYGGDNCGTVERAEFEELRNLLEQMKDTVQSLTALVAKLEKS